MKMPRNFKVLKAISLITAATFLATLLVQNASAIPAGLYIDDRQYFYLETGHPILLGGGIGANYLTVSGQCTSWLKVVRTSTRIYYYNWIVVDNGDYGSITCLGCGLFNIMFPTYTTISYIAVTVTSGIGQPYYLIVGGGVGYNYVSIYVEACGTFDYYVKTNYIPSNYLGSIAPITIQDMMVTGEINQTVVYLKL